MDFFDAIAELKGKVTGGPEQPVGPVSDTEPLTEANLPAPIPDAKAEPTVTEPEAVGTPYNVNNDYYDYSGMRRSFNVRLDAPHLWRKPNKEAKGVLYELTSNKVR